MRQDVLLRRKMMKNEKLSWLFITYLAVILASIAFIILSMTRGFDPINIVFIIIHSATLMTVVACWIYDIALKKRSDKHSED